MTTIYVTKYALTKGIIEMESHDVEATQASVINDYGLVETYHFPEFFMSKSEAVKKANEMVSKKISSLRKQINKLETMKF